MVDKIFNMFLWKKNCYFLGDARSKSKAENKGTKSQAEKKAPPPKDAKAAKGKEVCISVWAKIDQASGQLNFIKLKYNIKLTSIYKIKAY